MERRSHERIPSQFAIEVEADGRRWPGVLINYSAEGALLRLTGLWATAKEVSLVLDPDHRWEGFSTLAKVVRASSPDGEGTFLALRFPQTL